MAEIVLAFAAPALPNEFDAGVSYTLGVDFAASAPLNCVGVQWVVPATAPSLTSRVSLWDPVGETEIAGKDVDFTGQGGQTVRTRFDTPVALTASTAYRASVFVRERYVATVGATWPATTGVITAGADNGWLAFNTETHTIAFPGTESGGAANFHVSPIIDDGVAPSTRRRRRTMTAYVRGTEGRLNDILTTLGTTTPSLWPFWEATGTLVTAIGPGDLIPSETAGAAEALEDDFAPVMLPCGLFAYHFHPTGDHHLAGIDHANYSFGNATVDTPMSIGAWIRPNVVTAGAIMAKYDSAGTLREWRFHINSSSQLALELYDESADTTETGVSTSTVTAGQWQFVAVTYDGGETDPVVRFYINGVDVGDAAGATTEAGAYIAMENTTAPLTVGCSGVSATPVNEFHGRIALPFLTGKALTAVEVASLMAATAPMVGIT